MPLLYLGPEGSYSHLAAQKARETVSIDAADKLFLQACGSFDEIFSMLEDDSRDNIAIVPIENSITSDVSAVSDTLFLGNYLIWYELYLHIHLHMFSHRGVSLEDVSEVLSHPKALEQVKTFTKEHTYTTKATDSTSAAAAVVASAMSSSAAVGSRGLGALFPELQLIAEDIGDESMNKTRFLLLSSRENNTTMALLRESITSNSEKATVLFELPHQVGSLAQVLSALAEQNCNLSKIQSKNIVSDDFQYAFWIDVELPSIHDKV